MMRDKADSIHQGMLYVRPRSSLGTCWLQCSKSLSKPFKAYCTFGSAMLTVAYGSSIANCMPTTSAIRWLRTHWVRNLSVGTASGDVSRTSKQSAIYEDHRTRFGRLKPID